MTPHGSVFIKEALSSTVDLTGFFFMDMAK